uniref:Bacterial surface antigen (D15) domain-containing protein n=1 Tax=Oryza meridionalis TaxID=40149 RepID=A0A0E0F1J8_9ORYZ
MEAWTIRVVYFIVFSFFLVSARFGSCAPCSEEGRVLLRYSESERDKSTDSLSNRGEGKVIGRVLNLLLKEKMFSSETPSELKELGTISESVADGTGGFEHCRKCLANRTRRAAVEAAVGSDLPRAATVRDLVRAAAAAADRIRRLGAFDTVSITLDAAPPGIPGNAAVIVLVDVAEARGRAAGELGIFANKGTRSCSVQGSVKLKNLFGYCETWDASGDLGLDQTLELSTGVAIPRIGAIPTPLVARISFLSEDWLKSSLKEHVMGVSVGLLSTMNHNLAYNLSWRTITDRALMSSNSIRGQLGHSLLSSIKYAYKVDQRDSRIRPTRGYAYLFSSQVGGLAPESKDARYIRQEIDLRVALPLGVLNGAVNAGVAGGIIHPLARGSTGSISPLSEQFYLGGNRSLMCRLGGPSSLLGFKKRGLGTDLRSSTPENSENVASTSPEPSAQGGDIAVTAFADLSFDIPLKPLRELGIHGHAFVSAGNLAKLTDTDLRKFPLAEFLQTFRSSAGFGVVVPTRLFRIEVNYCHILKQFDYDLGKAGIQLNFSSP